MVRVPIASAAVLVLAACSSAPPVLRLLREVRIAGGPVTAVDLSRDGTLLASGGSGGDVFLRRVADRHEVLRIDACEGEVGQVALAPDGRMLAVVGADLSLWAVPAGTLVCRLPVPGPGQARVAWSRDGRWFAFPVAGNRVAVLDARKVETVAERRIGSWEIHTLAFSPSGTTLYCSERKGEGEMFAWDWQAADEPKVVAGTFYDSIHAVLHDGRLLRGTWADGLVAGAAPVSPEGVTRVLAAAAAPDSDRFAVLVDGEPMVRVFDEAGRPAAKLAHGGSRLCFALGPGDLAATGGQDGRIQLWRGGESFAELGGHAAEVIDVAFTGDGRTLLGRTHAKTFAYDLDSQRLTELPHSDAVAGGMGARGVLLVRGRRLLHQPAPESAPEKLLDLPEESLLVPSTSRIIESPDGRHAAVGHGGQVSVVDVAGATQQIVVERFRDLLDAAWSHQGTGALVLELRDLGYDWPPSRLTRTWLADPGKTPREVPGVGSVLGVAWLAEGTSLLLAEEDHLECQRLPDGDVVARAPGTVLWLRHLGGRFFLAHDRVQPSLWQVDPLRRVASWPLPRIDTARNEPAVAPRWLAWQVGGDSEHARIRAAALARDRSRAAFAGARGVFVYAIER